MVTITMLVWIHTFSSHVRPCRCATQITEDVLVRSMPDPTFGCVNEHELMMLVCVVRKLDLISDKPIVLTAPSILVNTTNDLTLITNHNRPASVYVNPHMRTISLCIMGSPFANFSAIPARLHTGIPICIRRSPYAKLHIWGYKTKFPIYAHNFIMHTGSD